MQRRSQLLASGLGALTILLVVPSPGRAQAGSLDRTFGDDGRVTTPFYGPTSDTARSVVVAQADGKLVVAGRRSASSTDFALVRYDRWGTLDATFGEGGKVTTDFAGGVDSIHAVAMQPDGKIVAAGSTAPWSSIQDFALARYHGDGRLDASFGDGGRVVTSLGASHDVAFGVAVQPDGKIVVGGYTWADARRYDFALVRYAADGRLDPSFGSGGIVTAHFGSDDQAFAIALQPDGKIVAAGRSFTAPAPSGWKLSMIRVHPDGTPDTTFGVGGGTLTYLGSPDDGAYALAVQADGRLVAAGFTRAATRGYEFAVIRCLANGALDTGFGIGGGRIIGFGPLEDRAFAAAVQPDGRILLAGGSVTHDGLGASFALVRLDSQGALDASFGAGGLVTTTVGGFNSAYGLALPGDGSIVAAGTSGSAFLAASNDFALASYRENGSLDPAFGTGGKVTTDFGQRVRAAAQDIVAVQADGRFVVAGYRQSPSTLGDFCLVRYQPDGSLDTGFGQAGIVTTDFSFSMIASDMAASVAIQPDGKILAAGTTDRNYAGASFAVARYNADGSPDTSFGSLGEATAAPLYYSYGSSMALLGDGRILVAGRGYDPFVRPYSTDFALTCLLPNGSIDRSFGSNGYVVTDFGIDNAGVNDIALQHDGRILLVGYATASNGGYVGALACYDASGRLDPSFGIGGKATIDFGVSWSSGIQSVAVQADGKLVLVASSPGPALYETDFAVVRCHPDGSFDPTFGNGGSVATRFAHGSSGATCVAIQGDGRIVVGGGGTGPTGRSDFALARYQPDGSLDLEFGEEGRVLTDFESPYGEGALGLALHAGKIVLVGSMTDGSGFERFALARYHGSDLRVRELEALLRQVEGLAAARTLNHGQTRSLQTKLEAALQQLDRGMILPALHQVSAFAQEVNALVQARVLTAVEAQDLYFGAALLIAMLS